MEKEIKVTGMHCSACSKRVENALNAIDGVCAKVDLKNGTVTVSSEQNVSDDKLKEAIESLGFDVNE